MTTITIVVQRQHSKRSYNLTASIKALFSTFTVRCVATAVAIIGAGATFAGLLVDNNTLTTLAGAATCIAVLFACADESAAKSSTKSQKGGAQ